MSTIIENRYDIVCFIQAENCNPNGDPQMGNLPRQDDETEKGIITDVAIKRRIRNYVQGAYGDKSGYDIIIKAGESINKAIAEVTLNAAKASTKKDIPADFNHDEAANEACRRYWDVRTFGAVLSTGMNAGQIQGAVQIGMASSLDKVSVQDITITRMAYADAKDMNTVEEYEKEKAERAPDKRRTMGTKQYISYGLYKVKITISANLAQKSRFTEDDLAIFLEALMLSYSNEVSATKMGMDVLSPIVVFKHVGTQDAGTNTEQLKKEAMLGCAPAYKLFDLVDVRKNPDVETPRSYNDYVASIDTTKLPAGVKLGFKRNPFGAVEWDPKEDEWIQVK